MHLVYKALDNCPIPSVLPAELMPRSKQSGRPLVAGLPPDFSTDTLGTRRRPSTPSSVGALDVALHNVSTAHPELAFEVGLFLRGQGMTDVACRRALLRPSSTGVTSLKHMQ